MEQPDRLDPAVYFVGVMVTVFRTLLERPPEQPFPDG
jgi:hypothetical protein